MNCELRKGKKIYLKSVANALGHVTAQTIDFFSFSFFIKKIKKKKKRACECIKSLTFKSHNFVIIGVCLRFVLIENGKLYFKPHN